MAPERRHPPTPHSTDTRRGVPRPCAFSNADSFPCRRSLGALATEGGRARLAGTAVCSPGRCPLAGCARGCFVFGGGVRLPPTRRSPHAEQQRRPRLTPGLLVHALQRAPPLGVRRVSVRVPRRWWGVVASLCGCCGAQGASRVVRTPLDGRGPSRGLGPPPTLRVAADGVEETRKRAVFSCPSTPLRAG